MDNFTWNSNYNLIVDCRGLPEDYQRFLKLSRIFDSFRGRDYRNLLLYFDNGLCFPFRAKTGQHIRRLPFYSVSLRLSNLTLSALLKCH